MKLLKNFKEQKLPRLLQLGAHFLYILLVLLFFYGFQRPFFYYPLLMITNFIIYYVLISIANKIYAKKEELISLTPVVMAGTLMLNLEAYDFKAYALAGFFGVMSRAFIKTKLGHVFNPGYFGAFVLAMLLPRFGYPSIGLWKSDLKLLILIAVLGFFIVYRAKRLQVILSYVGGFVSISILAAIFFRIIGFKFNGVDEVPILFWPATLITTTSVIFIFHVISDPKTSPSSIKEQIIFGALIGIIDYILRISLIIPAEAISYLLVQSGYSLYKIYQKQTLPVTG